MTDPDPTTQLKSLSRQHLRLVWQAALMSGELSDDNRRAADAMRAHPEYAHLWPRLDQLTDAEITAGDVNPILHITMHAAVESQVADGEPPEAAQTVAALERRGLSHHEAIHRVAAVLTDEIWHMMSEQRPFDQARYAASLAELLRAQRSHAKKPSQTRKDAPPRQR